MIPLLADKGFRVIAPDLVGFGKSDKPTQREDYTYARHVTWMSDWMTQLNLQDVTMFCQDWGSLIGLRVLCAFPERFSGVVLSNGGMPAGVIPEEFAAPLKEAYKTLEVVKATQLGEKFADTSGIPGFLYWRKYCSESEAFDVGDVVGVTAAEPLPAAIVDAYRAPFPDLSYASGARQFPTLVPVFKDEPEAATNEEAWKVLDAFEKPFLLAFADKDPVTAGGDAVFKERVPGCQGMPHRTIENAGHFVQEDQPEACVQALLDVMSRY